MRKLNGLVNKSREIMNIVQNSQIVGLITAFVYFIRMRYFRNINWAYITKANGKMVQN